MVFELRPRGPVSAGVPLVDRSPESLLGARQALGMHLLEEHWADGKPRKTSTLLLFLHEGRLKGCIRDRNTDETAWVSSDSLEGILDALEVGLQEGALDWRREGKRQKR